LSIFLYLHSPDGTSTVITELHQCTHEMQVTELIHSDVYPCLVLVSQSLISPYLCD